MIGYLRGKIRARLGKDVVVDVNGVGYRVTANCKQDEVELFIHTAVREDAITLYGFGTVETLQLFELLITVSGIGPKTAMHIVELGTASEIEEAIRRADVNFLTKASGLGKKGAQRLMVDLKNKIGSYKEIDLGAEEGASPVAEALMGFGFRAAEVTEAIKQIDQNLSEGEQIKLGLKLLGRRLK
jgi:Holliday junction DNA helicase RuvA